MKGLSLKKLCNSRITQRRIALAVALIAFAQTNAFALGGLDTANTTASDIRLGIYTLVGTLSLCYLLWIGVNAYFEKKAWADFGWGVVHVAAVGGSSALGTWAWGVFS
jgi:hypothetical protein